MCSRDAGGYSDRYGPPAGGPPPADDRYGAGGSGGSGYPERYRPGGSR